jgi:hypothetical protein
MFTSRLVSSFFRMARDQPALPTRAMPLFIKTSIPKLISLPLFMDLLLLSGVLSPRNRLRALLHRVLELLAGIVLWLRLGIQACHLSLSTPTSNVKVFARQHSMLLSVH